MCVRCRNATLSARGKICIDLVVVEGGVRDERQTCTVSKFHKNLIFNEFIQVCGKGCFGFSGDGCNVIQRSGPVKDKFGSFYILYHLQSVAKRKSEFSKELALLCLVKFNVYGRPAVHISPVLGFFQLLCRVCDSLSLAHLVPPMFAVPYSACWQPALPESAASTSAFWAITGAHVLLHRMRRIVALWVAQRRGASIALLDWLTRRQIECRS